MERLKGIIAGVMAEKQVFDWGHVNWIQEPEDFGNMLIGHVIFLPNKAQGLHLHTGDEQMIYTISGKGEHWIDSQFYPLTPGSFYHIPPHAEHDIRNVSDELLEMIIVYNINHHYLDDMVPKISFFEDTTDTNLLTLVDKTSLDRIISDLATAIDLGIKVCDAEGNVLTSSGQQLAFCRYSISLGKKCTFDDLSDLPKEREDQHVITSCCCDLVKITSPIYLNETLLGYIVCGPVIINSYDKEQIHQLEEQEQIFPSYPLVDAYLQIRRLTKSRIYAIVESLKRINHYIVDIALKRTIEDDRKEKTMELLRQRTERVELEKSLMESQMEVIRAQISPHFLFNTLGTIGQLAYMAGAHDAAETTFALSNLLRRNLKEARKLVTVKEEIDYINDYLLIQNKRFGDMLKIVYEVEAEAMRAQIPFMTIQTFVENAIKHGFDDFQEKGMVCVQARCEESYLYLIVEDNGKGISEEALRRFREEEKQNQRKVKSLGLDAIRKRLAYYFSENFDMTIDRRSPKGTRVHLCMPVVETQREI